MAKKESLSQNARSYFLDKIEQSIRAGETKLPTERELAGEVTASYATVRLIMKQLEDEGLIRKIRGSGTYIDPGAAERLRALRQRRVQVYTPNFIGNAEENFGVYLKEHFVEVAAKHNISVEFHYVSTHEEFIAKLDADRDHDREVFYIPPTQAFTIPMLGKIAKHTNVKLIFIDCELENLDVFKVSCDNRYGGMLAASHLLKKGHKKIVVLVTEPKFAVVNARITGFKETLELNGITPEILDCHVKTNDCREILSAKTLAARLKKGVDFTAIFSISDAGTFGALQALESAGLTPGKDISIVSYDGVPALAGHTPALTSVIQPVDEICEAGFELLDSDGPPVQKRIPPKLRQGASVVDLMLK